MRVLAFLALAGVAAVPQDTLNSNSYKGKAPPELVSSKEHWLNAPEGLTFAKLKGKAVWVEFGFINCVPCKLMKPVLAEWHKTYGPKGLEIVDVFDGNLDEFDAVKKAVAEHGEKVAVLWDKEGKNVTAYGVEAYPAAYLIGVDGTVLWEGLPSPARCKQLEPLIEKELEKVKKPDGSGK